jgi:hypothetical protein
LGVVNDVIVESRIASGALNSNPPYVDSSFLDSTLKSSAPGLTGTGSRYATGGTPSFTIQPTLAVAGGTYDVYLTHGKAGSISDDIIVAVTLSLATGLPGTTTLFQEPGGNTWEYLGRITLDAGVTVPALTFTYQSGTLNTAGNGRMYSDSIKFVYVPPPPPPTITSQPQSRTVNEGANVSFSVTATGAAPLAYQWRFNESTVPGATGATYNLSNVQPDREGDYSVTVSNISGVVTSDTAFLVVNVPPTIGVEPESQTVRAGEDAVFSVSAGGTEPLSYQWRFNEAIIAGATAGDYTRIGAQTNDAGGYSVVITNVAGSVTSAVAMLVVTRSEPVRFDSIELLPEQRVRLVISGEPGEYFLDVSGDATNWAPITNLVLPDSPLEFIETTSNAATRFYRIRQ